MRFILLIIFSNYTFLFCQINPIKINTDKDSVVSIKKNNFKPKHSPKMAAIFSAVAPGAGQIYNGKYWKAPIVWAGLGTFAYLWINENNRYIDARDAYLTYLDNDPTNDQPFNGSTNVNIIQSTKNVYRNQRDMYLLFGVLFYGLNIVDAAVDAHFMNFDVSDDLSLNFNFDTKSYQTNTAVPSLTLTLQLKK